MSYMRQWRGKTEPDDKTGEAEYMVDGELFHVPLPTFEHAQRLDTLLDVAFQQGKQFAFQGVKRAVDAAMIEADRQHALTMRTKR